MNQREIEQAIAAECHKHSGERHMTPKDEHFLSMAESVLSIVQKAIPGLASLIDGTGVVVPREPTSAMIRDGVSYRLSTSISGENNWPEDTAKLYRVMVKGARS